ncbi:hypothetical protein OH76DRAFT_847438 [Lentinus brumalis]|uniref:Uncharacterized protein n=1 Tax=Lentinus brumalis TaxID=2498619 RepID=A0A371DQS5_9APHY|nr:hypothetical protein OH76DRAFT_847438 [Polyporus brumalis]
MASSSSSLRPSELPAQQSPSVVASCCLFPFPMPRRISLLSSRASTQQAPSEIAPSASSTTTPLISAAQIEPTVATINPQDSFETVQKVVLSASSVARPVSRWLGPLRGRYPQHHIYRGLKYWEKGFADIQFVVENFVDWRDKKEVVELVQSSAIFVHDLAEIRQRLDLEECRDWKRDVRTFMVDAENSSQQAKAQFLVRKLGILSVAAKNSASTSPRSATSFGSRRPSPLRNKVIIESRTPACGPTMLPLITDSQDPFADGGTNTPKAVTLSVAQGHEAIEEDDDAQPPDAAHATGESIAMAILKATAWVEEQHPRGLRRVSSLPNI